MINKQKRGPITFLEIEEAAKKRVAVISKEFSNGFEFIKNYPRSVTFFGSARAKEESFYYNKARNLARRIVNELHYSVITGGGPGIMEAANKGAYEAGGNSVGLNISLPNEQSTNPYLTDYMNFYYFFSRKVCLSFSAEAYVFFPGGFGTLDEFLEILTLVQTGKVGRVPIILVGEKFWLPFEELFKEKLAKENFIDDADISLYKITDNEEEILETIKTSPVRIGLEYNQKSEEVAKKNGDSKAGHPIGDLFRKLF